MRIGRIDSPSTKLIGYINGLTAANNAANPNTNVDFGAGVAWCNDRLIETTSTRTKTLSGTWAAGNNNGGRFSGVSLSADTWYHCFIMRNTSTNAIDFGFDTSPTGASKPSGWNVRLIWSICTDSSGYIKPFVQNGAKCTWINIPVDYWGNIGQVSPLLIVLSTPTGFPCKTQVVGAYYPGGTFNYVYLSDASQPDDPASGAENRLTSGYTYGAGAGFEKVMVTDSLGRIRARTVESGYDDFVVGAKGWWHPERQ